MERVDSLYKSVGFEFDNYKMMQSALLTPTLLFLLILSCLSQPYNTSLCTDIVIGDLHYYINANSNNLNIIDDTNGSTIVYNLCKQV